ncbi:hypothetical protein ACFOWU_11790 [Epilithonimonas zeae]|uniref:Signal peptidase n=2 Tax=Epilithonimonas zeae TaxID=1416779 RepID=A0A1N6J7L3_9FLAO|nr:hypothetical protein SAMN05444409_3380 [Epilithonimonas zeae]
MMTNLLFKKVYGFLFLVMSILAFGQSVPPPPENPESGDIGAYPASPIDDYVIGLFLVALVMIVVFVIKSRQRTLQ